MPATSGMSLSPPMPIARRTDSYATVIPCSAKAPTHARACASLLSTSVPSTSKITAASRSHVRQNAASPSSSSSSFEVLSVVELVGLVRHVLHLVGAAAHDRRRRRSSWTVRSGSADRVSLLAMNAPFTDAAD